MIRVTTKGFAMSVSRFTTYTLALTAGFAIVAVDLAHARVGGGSSFGSRGTRTYSAPKQTDTAPKAAPIDRSMTQKGAPTTTAQTHRPVRAPRLSRRALADGVVCSWVA